MPCQSSSVMNGRNGWNIRSVLPRTKSITASLLARKAGDVASLLRCIVASEPDAASRCNDSPFNASTGRNAALLASTYQSQYSLQKKRYNACTAVLKL